MRLQAEARSRALQARDGDAGEPPGSPNKMSMLESIIVLARLRPHARGRSMPASTRSPRRRRTRSVQKETRKDYAAPSGHMCVAPIRETVSIGLGGSNRQQSPSHLQVGRLYEPAPTIRPACCSVPQRHRTAVRFVQQTWLNSSSFHSHRVSRIRCSRWRGERLRVHHSDD
jgi:hypothetical protein